MPLVVFPVGALYRQEMIHALESIGRRWRIGYSSASLASLVAAVGAGLGVSLLPLGCVGPEHRLLGAQAGFPPIAGLELALYARPELGQRRAHPPRPPARPLRCTPGRVAGRALSTVSGL
ncbi:lysR family transcriptional regulator [Pseudomonas aeruginosa]|nr:lysR family transcriptional regulator [Pseudomonas aeruginosa]